MFESLLDFNYWKTFVQPGNFTLDQIPDLTGKTAIVTGGSAGLGYATSLALARNGAHVFLASRDPKRANDAIERIERELAETAPHLYPKVDFLPLDLADLKAVVRSANEFLAKGIKLDILVNNAADAYSPIVHYNRSKLANILYVKALARRLADAGHDRVFVNAVSPGFVKTEIDTGLQDSVGLVLSKVMSGLRHVVGRIADDGALTQLYCASSPEIEEKKLSGRYFVPDAHELRPSPYAMSKDLQERLFKYSEDFVVKRGLLPS
ncbi:hypothetical protein BGZ94_010392 [Podila epigama]|nr:hypothetical protein BGZ94_010392 [Podila epigama]